MRFLTAQPPPDGEVTAPTRVPLSDFVEALRPVLSLLGLSPEDVQADGFEITEREITLRSCVPIAGVGPVPSSSDEIGIWTWPVSVMVDRP